MIMKQMLSALVPSVFSKTATPRGSANRRERTGLKARLEAAMFKLPSHACAPSRTVSVEVEHLLTTIKPKFNPRQDLLIVPSTVFKEVKKIDRRGWIDSIADRVIVLSDDVIGVSVVSQGRIIDFS